MGNLILIKPKFVVIIPTSKSLDCPFGDDENNCWHIESVPIPKSQCNDGEFECIDKMCLPQDMICDGHKQCYDGEDENPEMCEKYKVNYAFFQKKKNLLLFSPSHYLNFSGNL
jgi:hypothetical protein